MAATHLPRWVEQVLSFWFVELTQHDWFVSNSAVDEAISQRFQDLPGEVVNMDTSDLLRAHETALAGVITLDQFPRNLYRGTAKSFTYDSRALDLATKAIRVGLDEGLSVDQRLFLYLPFEHSEAVADQTRAVSLISALGDARYTEFALSHKDVIDRFGRFPHRNKVLDRQSTPDEMAYLAEPGSGF